MLEALWDDAVSMVRYHEDPRRHGPRGTLAYAGVLLRDGSADALERAERAVRAVLAIQERRPWDAHCGNFRWTLEEEVVRDLNAVEFMLDGIVPLLRDHRAQMSGALADEMREAIALGLEEIDRLDVHPSYTNIYLSDVANSVLGGEAVGDAYFVERGVRKLDGWSAFTDASGAPHEFNSPTYLAVDIERMAALAEHALDPDVRLKARIAEERLWLHVAAHWHPELAQLGGPHSRSYYDGWTGAGGYLKLILWKLLGDEKMRRPTPYAAHDREEGHTGIARTTFHLPDYLRDMLAAKTYPFSSAETTDTANGLDITTHMTEAYALGTASRTFVVGELPEPWASFNSLLLQFRRDVDPGYGTLSVRYIIDDADGEPHIELIDQGNFVATQHENRAIAAYGLMPRLRPMRSAKLSVRMLGVSDETRIWIGERRIDALPAGVEPGEPVVIAEGGVYIAVVPLEPSDMGSDAPIELRRDGHMLTLDIYNYRGPAKQFWEHRTQSGPFYKANIRSAFVLEAAARGEFDDAGAFREHIARARIADTLDQAYVREIAYISGGRTLSMRYSLRDMRLVERRHDGVAYAPPVARAGSTRGDGARYVVSRDGIVRAGGAMVMAGGAPIALIADAGRGRYVAIKAGDDETPLLIETGTASVECDALGVARVDVDERAAIVAIEAVGVIGPVRIRGSADLALSINGADVTGSMTAAGDGVREFRGL